MTDELIARTLWEEMIREEAQDLADRHNSCEACCGSYGTATWKDYEQDVRVWFEEIGAAYVAIRTLSVPAIVEAGDDKK